MIRKDLEYNELVSELTYIPETGLFLRNKDGGGMYKGDVSGTLDHQGYIKIYVLRKAFLAHRLAWLYMTGEWPKNEIDHINGIRSDNRIINLRDCTRRENEQNISIHRSGVKRPGYNYQEGSRHPWRAEIFIDGKNRHIGCYDTEEEAYQAYVLACNKLGVENANT